MKNKKRRYLAWIALLTMLLNGFACTKTSVPDQDPFSGSSFSSESNEEPDGGDKNTADESDNASDTGASDSDENIGEDASDAAPPDTEITPTPPQKFYTQYIRCTAERVNIRAGAGTSHTIIGSAERSTVYALNKTEGSWHQTYYQGKIAYISASYTVQFSLEKSDDPRIEHVLEEGYKLIGVPYVYGAVRLHDGKGNLLKGFTTKKFDCSSLVQYVFYKGANVLLDTTTRTQIKQGVYVPPKNLRAGDCIFFTNEERQYKTGIERVGHVAIYLGNNYILHTASDYARIEPISQKRWNFYIEARRFL